MQVNQANPERRPRPERRPQPERRSIGAVLVANRGEIVLRIARTLARRGMRSIAVYTDHDRDARHVRVVDDAYGVPSYLDARAVVQAALRAGADAVHPGYGFLAEDPGFARMVIEAGLVWVGPPPEAMETMGDKIRAKETVAAAGVPVVPGAGRAGMSDADLVHAAHELGFPVLLKPSAGGGGKGMHLVEHPEDLPAALERAQHEALGAFGDGTLLVERWITRPRHVEIQIFCDMHGGAVHLGTRECSLQRRHQKIVEETPSPAVGAATREAMTSRAFGVAGACGYVGAGTVEFIVSSEKTDEFYFMEMNTRLQVEHPITEAVTGVDLVDWQLRVAAGEDLPLAQGEIEFSGHAVEARLYAEDPARNFLPATGEVLFLAQPESASGVRVDSALGAGLVVGPDYDPMLAKVSAWGETRGEAVGRLRAALGATAVLGVTTNVGYLTRLLAHPDVAAGRIDTGLVERTVDQLAPPGDASDELAAVVAACRIGLGLEPAALDAGPWDIPDSWRLGGFSGEWAVALRRPPSVALEVRVQGRISAGATVTVDAGVPHAVSVEGGRASDAVMSVTIDGEASEWQSAVSSSDVWVCHFGQTWCFSTVPAPRTSSEEAVEGASTVTSPMPGIAVSVLVAEGDEVRAGQTLVVVEAMKMEHSVVSPRDGVVRHVWAREGHAVALDEALAEVVPA